MRTRPICARNKMCGQLSLYPNTSSTVMTSAKLTRVVSIVHSIINQYDHQVQYSIGFQQVLSEPLYRDEKYNQSYQVVFHASNQAGGPSHT
jgi:hypothetical protein